MGLNEVLEARLAYLVALNHDEHAAKEREAIEELESLLRRRRDGQEKPRAEEPQYSGLTDALAKIKQRAKLRVSAAAQDGLPSSQSSAAP